MRLGDGRSLTFTVVVSLVVVTTLFFSIFGAISYRAEKQQYTDELQSSMNALASQLAISLVIPTWNYDTDFTEEILDSVMQNKQVYGVYVKYGPISAKVRNDNWLPVSTETIPEDEGLLTTSRDLIHNGEKIGSFSLYFSPKFMEEKLQVFLINIGFAIPILNIILISILFCFFVIQS